jgi:UDP-galactopyranose mutase
MEYDYLIVGAGLAGSVMAERLASQQNKKILLIEKRGHIGGNAYDEYDKNGILIHKYGPHIFHTNSKEVFDYLSQFTEWIPYEHRVLAKLSDNFYPIPINRITLNKLYNLDLQTEQEVEGLYERIKEKRSPIKNSEDIIVNQVGVDLFEKFFKNFTRKQWSLEPKELSPTVCGRIPIRTNDDCRYFTDKYQFMPKDGYTKMFEKILSNNNIEVVLNTDYKEVQKEVNFKKLIYTGPIDYFFDYKFGKLPYRSIRFEFENHNISEFQPTAQVNYVDSQIEYTRVVEYKKMTGQIADSTTISKEYLLSEGEPFYPIPSDNSNRIFRKYKLLSESIENVIFCGRLAEYQYFNMDQVVANTLKIFSKLK